jgi:hypothetical protein
MKLLGILASVIWSTFGVAACCFWIEAGRARGAGGFRRRLSTVEVFGITNNGLKSHYSYSGGCEQMGWARQRMQAAWRRGGREVPMK